MPGGLTAPPPGGRIPDYEGVGLVNLVAEIEHRLTGTAPSPPLAPDLGAQIPEAASFVLVLFDGLGDLQLDAEAAAPLRRARRGALDAPFSTQTSVATATIATGLAPSRHGLIAYLLHEPGAGGVVNTIWWMCTDGRPATLPPESFLPSPTLAERLAAAGSAPAVVLPAGLVGTTLERLLFRGAKPLPWSGVDDLVAATQTAAASGRTVVVYVPQVDSAAHYFGQSSAEYGAALEEAGRIWEALASTLPERVALVGTADHGHVDIPRAHAVELHPPRGVTLYGDSRVVYAAGDAGAAARMAADMPGSWIPVEEMDGWWGPEPHHPRFAARAPVGVLVADVGFAFGFPGNDAWTLGQHGGLTEAELRIPLLVRHEA